MSYDRHTPALLIMIGTHAWDYGALATVRTLGRVGVPVFVGLSDPHHPLTTSKYLTEAFTWPTTGGESPDELVAGIRALCARIGKPAVAIAGDDESAVLLASRRDDLSDVLLLPRVDPALPGVLAGKGSLADLCRETDTPTPASVSPTTMTQIREFAATGRFPMVVKNPEPFSRLVDRSVPVTSKADDADALFALLANWEPGTPLVVQEFLPQESSQDWYVEAVLDDANDPVVAFSGVKLRAFPDGTGVGTLSEARYDADLIERAMTFCREVGYSGVCDMDWRLDERDGEYKLLDFNPRRGAQFSTFRTTAGVDVVRALHLMMTGRPVPQGVEVEGVRHVVGVLDQRAYLARRGQPDEPPPVQGRGAERAWWAGDDPRPGLVFGSQLGPWGRAVRRKHSSPTPDGWRRVMQSHPVPTPFDKPGPPRPVERWRACLSVAGAECPVLVAVAQDPDAAQRLAHEDDARRWALEHDVAVPRVLASGHGWIASELVDATPSLGSDYVDAALATARRIRAAATPPPQAVSEWEGSRRDLVQRLMRAVMGRLPIREFRRVRAEAAALPVDAWVHGDFSSANAMNSASGVLVIDWEFCGQGIFGTDEVRLWTTLEDARDREHLMSQFLAEVPPERRRDTGVLIHWLALRQLAENLAAPKRHQNPDNIRLGHITLVEARQWRARLDQPPTR